ncbi:MAG: PIN domain-containing protein [Proteobacteria bacterium]|nr:PIN domain-containing protein [Pseudomonadota bacterium]
MAIFYTKNKKTAAAGSHDFSTESPVIHCQTIPIIKLELLGGTKTEKEFNRLKSRLQALETISATITQWEKAYEIAFALRRSGVTVPYTDILIAACALTAGATVIHADIHFDMMAKSLPLKTESYVKTAPFELLR